MQAISTIPSDSTNSELKMTNENHDDSPTPPPPYRNVMDKLKNDNYFSTLPPSYTDINSPAVVYINNYPGPPLSDGVVQITTARTQSSAPNLPQENILSRKMRMCLVINGIITICLGVIAVGLQIGLLASHSIVYYYYGFWAGALIISIGISTIMFNNRYRGYNISKYFRSFICQSIVVAVVLGFGFIMACRWSRAATWWLAPMTGCRC